MTVKLLFSNFVFLCLLFVSTTIQAQKQPEGPPNNEEEYKKQYEERIKKETLNGVYIPKNLEDAFTQLSKLTSQESREKFQKVPEDSVCYYLHTTLGNWMIINWGFYEGSRFSHYLKSAGVTNPDDMADLVITGWHRKLKSKEIDLKTLAKKYKQKQKDRVEKQKKKRIKN